MTETCPICGWRSNAGFFWQDGRLVCYRHITSAWDDARRDLLRAYQRYRAAGWERDIAMRATLERTHPLNLL